LSGNVRIVSGGFFVIKTFAGLCAEHSKRPPYLRRKKDILWDPRASKFGLRDYVFVMCDSPPYHLASHHLLQDVHGIAQEGQHVGVELVQARGDH
jgi:hypothetical protein